MNTNKPTFVTVSRNDLLQALNQMAPARQRSYNKSLPVFCCFIFIVEDGKFYVWTSDGSYIQINKQVKAQIDTENTARQIFPIYGSALIKMLRLMDEQSVQMTFGHSHVEVTHQSGKFFLPYERDYGINTTLDNNTPKHTVKIELPDFHKFLTDSIFCTAKDELRPVMNGIYFDFRDDHLVLTASDGHKLVKTDAWSVPVDFTDSFILQGSVAVILSRILPKVGYIEILLFDLCVFFRVTDNDSESLIVKTVPIDGRYLNYLSVIPNDSPYHITVNRRQLLTAVRRASILSNDSNFLLEFYCKPYENTLTIDAQDHDLEIGATEKLSAQYDKLPDGFKFGMKAPSLESILKHLTTDDIIINIQDCTRAFTFVPSCQNAGDDEVLYLLMPMLVYD